MRNHVLEISYTIDVDNVLVKNTSDLIQPLFQIINVVDAYVVNKFLHGGPYLIVNCVEVWSVWRPQIQRTKSLASLDAVVRQFHKHNVQVYCYAEF